MPISEERLKKRLEVRKEQAAGKDVLACKLRAKIKAGYLPTTPEEFAGVLRVVAEHAKHVGYEEECREILEKLSEGPMPIEKTGVECGGDHSPTLSHMEKKASGDIQCRFCGQKFAAVTLSDDVPLQDGGAQPKKDARDAIDKMFNT